jgi:uncharacterized membrane protein YhaH (DUF805 family)
MGCQEKEAEGGEHMRRIFGVWVAWFVLLFVLDFTIPFLWLNDVPHLVGSFLFWVVWILVAMVSMSLMFRRWREPQGRNDGDRL